MYIFRIVSPVDKTKSWYQGEFIDPQILSNVSVTPPQGYPPSAATADHIGDFVEYNGYIYSSLKDNNTDIPATNYEGYPLTANTDSDAFGKKSWIRTDYANNMMMLLPESCGITESYTSDITGRISKPHDIPYIDSQKCSCVLFCGVLGRSITVGGQTKTNIDVSIYENGIGNPETSGLNTSFTVSHVPSDIDPDFSFTIRKSANSLSSYCSGGYVGSWSYLGITQWTNHKKSTNDYSRQDQDEWGNYELSKNRTGRTYSADVILTPRIGAVDGDYDYNLNDLCFSVTALLQSQLGVVNAFYFNNQDIGVPWIPHNTNRAGELVQLNDSDIIVGIITSFKVHDIQGNKAVLSITVQSVPNEYKNYQAPTNELPVVAPAIPGVTVCERVDFINLNTGLVLVNGGEVAMPPSTAFTPRIRVEPFPSDAKFDLGTVQTPNTATPGIEWNIIDNGSTRVIQFKGQTPGSVLFRIQPRAWTENNTYGNMMAHIFYVRIT